MIIRKKTSAKRVLALLLAAILMLSALPVTSASAASTGSDTYIRTSLNPNNYLEFSLNGTTLTLRGKLILENLSGLLLAYNDEQGIFSVGDGQTFSATVPLSGITAPTALNLYASRNGSTWYQSLVANRIYVEPNGAGGYRFISSSILESNLAFANAWLNPADYLDASGVPQSAKELSAQIVGSETDDYTKIFLLHQWTAKNIYYDLDYFEDRTSSTFYDTEDVLTYKRTVCEGYANVLRDLLLAQGIPAMKVTTFALGVGNNGSFAVNTGYAAVTSSNHAHVEAFVDGRWVTMDPTWDSLNTYEYSEFITEAPNGYYYFDISQEALAMDHKIITRGNYDLRLSSGTVINANTAENQKSPSSWALPEAFKALAQGLIPNALQGNYQTNITRKDFCHMIVNMLLIREGVSTINELLAKYGKTMQQNVFSDTTDTDIYTAYSLGIVSGNGAGQFEPLRNITRQEAASMLQRAANAMGIVPQGSEQNFADMSEIAVWAAGSVRFVSSLVSSEGSAVMTNTGGGNFSPLAYYTIEQSILTIYRLFCCK